MRGRGRGRTAARLRVLTTLDLLRASLTDAATLVALITIAHPTPLNLSAAISDDAGISTAALTRTNPTPRNLAAAITDENGVTTATLTRTNPTPRNLAAAVTDENGISTATATITNPAGNDAFTMMLLHGDGANGSTTIVDSGFHNQNAFSNTNVVNDTSQKKFGTASLFFHTSTGMNVTGNEPDIALGSGDFCIDFWIRFNNGAVFANFGQTLFDFRPGVEGFYPYCELSGLAKWRWRTNSSFIINQPGSALSALQWYHIAWLRVSNVLYLMQDGVQITSAGDTSNYQQGSSRPFMGYTGSNQPVDGWLDEFRISKGTSRFNPAGFTPPTVPYS